MGGADHAGRICACLEGCGRSRAVPGEPAKFFVGQVAGAIAPATWPTKNLAGSPGTARERPQPSRQAQILPAPEGDSKGGADHAGRICACLEGCGRSRAVPGEPAKCTSGSEFNSSCNLANEEFGWFTRNCSRAATAFKAGTDTAFI
jgi:hypothetical protein